MSWSGHVRHQAPLDLHHRQPGVGATNRMSAPSATGSRRRRPRHGPRRSPAPAARATPRPRIGPGWRCRARGRPGRRRPARRDGGSHRPSARNCPCPGRRRRPPSPERTTQRTAFSGFRRSPVATRAENMASSRAFILSVRTRRTSATPSSIVTLTRSFIYPVLLTISRTIARLMAVMRMARITAARTNGAGRAGSRPQ